jgi:hypothetical protein
MQNSMENHTPKLVHSLLLYRFSDRSKAKIHTAKRLDSKLTMAEATSNQLAGRELPETGTGTIDFTGVTNTNDDLLGGPTSLPELVRNLVSGISMRYVPEPSDDERTTDVIKGLGEYKTACRWACLFHEYNKQRGKTEQETWQNFYHTHPDALSPSQWERRSRTETDWQWPDPSTGLNYQEELDAANEDELDAKGYISRLGTGLRSSKRNNNCPLGTPELECYLKAVEKRILEATMDNRETNKPKEQHESKEIRDMMTKLSSSSLVAVPTNKTNSYVTMETKRYIFEVRQHLTEKAIELERCKLTEIMEQGRNLLSQVEELLSKGDIAFLTEKLRSKGVPIPKILVKDHKKTDSDGNYPTGFVCPAANFTAGFPKLGYKGIEKIFMDNKVIFGTRNIIQASDLKSKLESLHLTSNNATIASIDAEAMYPSIKYSLIEKAVHYYAEGFGNEAMNNIQTCLEMIKFSIMNTILTFVNKYYLYDGDCLTEMKGLTIGGYESPWLADLAMSYLLDKMGDDEVDNNPLDELMYFGIYHDDGSESSKGSKLNKRSQAG